jgi:hypothetical protein
MRQRGLHLALLSRPLKILSCIFYTYCLSRGNVFDDKQLRVE